MPQTKLNEFKRILKESIENSTSHGLPAILRSENLILRILWTICFILSLIYCIFTLIRSFEEYSNYEVVTQISNHRISSMEFPTVTFCNKNPYNIKNDKYKKIVDSIQEIDDLSVADPFYKLQYLNYMLIKETENIESPEFDNDVIKYNILHMFIDCRFNGIPCSVMDFEYFPTLSNGNCYKFNSGKDYMKNSVQKRSISSPGYSNGLRLELYVGDPSEKYQLTRSSGIRLFIHNSSSIPLTEIEGISLSSGFETDIAIDQVYKYRLSKPYSDCIKDIYSLDSFQSDLFNITLKSLGKYSQKYCLQYCYQNFMIKQCKCSDISAPIYEKSKKCGYEDVFCYLNAINNFSLTEESSKCFDHCPSECDSIDYKLRISQSEYPTLFYSKQIQNFINSNNPFIKITGSNEEVRKKVLAFNVYYDDISYTVIEEFPKKTIDSFIGELGGILGLCLGVSLLSLVEILEIIIKIFYHGIVALVKRFFSSILDNQNLVNSCL